MVCVCVCVCVCVVCLFVAQADTPAYQHSVKRDSALLDPLEPWQSIETWKEKENSWAGAVCMFRECLALCVVGLNLAILQKY